MNPMSKAWQKGWALSLLLAITLCFSGTLLAQEDPYETYVKTSKDFKRVKQDATMLWKAYPSWIYMPWYFQWSIGYDDAAGKLCQDLGINGGFTDRGDAKNLNWFNTFKLRFYCDHAAGKGDLHFADQYDSTKQGANRPVMLDDATKHKLEGILSSSISQLKSSPMRCAYALDDEISWGHFVKPIVWQITSDDNYRKWLEEIYGKGKAPANPGWISYDGLSKSIADWTLGTADASQLMDQWSFCDSWWNNLIGDLVEYSNTLDPETPCGFVGGQCPSAFGGYDYAKIMRKVQFLEAYNMSDSQSVIRSFNPGNALPTVTTFFFDKDTAKAGPDGVWQMWYYVAHGNRGHVSWVENWFDGKKPKPYLQEIAPACLEIGKKIGPLMTKAEWIHDGVAIYYNHASIQMSWILDATAHGGTWKKRLSDPKLGTSHNVRHAWVNMLRDEGIQYSFLNYADLIQNGVPKEYKVLILPATYCLSDAEAKQIKKFVEGGGTLVADFLPGIFDQHGKGRKTGGALDALFGIKHAPELKSADLFSGGKLWVETNQDEGYEAKNARELLSVADGGKCVKANDFNKAVRQMDVAKSNKVGSGTAVLMNLSPQWYNAYRDQGMAAAKKRDVFMDPVKKSGVKRWVEIEGAGDAEFRYEITYWKKEGRVLLFVTQNPEISVDSAGGGNSRDLKTAGLDITLKFGKSVSDIKDERTGKSIPAGNSIKMSWKQNEAVVLSFKLGNEGSTGTKTE